MILLINGDENYSRDFTCTDNIIQMNELALTTQIVEAMNTIYNIAFVDRATLSQLILLLQKKLVKYHSKINEVKVIYGPTKIGNISHSLANIEKAQRLLGYRPLFKLRMVQKKLLTGILKT
jgi:UDP-N-acetylglucosamine 4-epimerase